VTWASTGVIIIGTVGPPMKKKTVEIVFYARGNVGLLELFPELQRTEKNYKEV
jgi:hypothetical protein